MDVIKLTEKAIAVTGLPERAYEFRMSLKKTNHLIYRIGDTKADYINLPEGKWSILGFSQDLKEEQWGEVVQMFSAEKRIGGRRTFVSYTSKDIFDTATESSHTLLISKDLDPLLNHLILIQ